MSTLGAARLAHHREPSGCRGRIDPAGIGQSREAERLEARDRRRGAASGTAVHNVHAVSGQPGCERIEGGGLHVEIKGALEVTAREFLGGAHVDDDRLG